MRNRSPLIRVPARRGMGTRVELRDARPAGNPYLALGGDARRRGSTACRHKRTPRAGEREHLGDEPPREAAAAHRRSARTTSPRRCDELEKDDVITRRARRAHPAALPRGEAQEWREYISQVQPWEIEKYLEAY